MGVRELQHACMFGHVEKNGKDKRKENKSTNRNVLISCMFDCNEMEQKIK